jgi:hypothetical protein
VELEPLKRRPTTMATPTGAAATDGSEDILRRLVKQYGIKPAMLEDDEPGLSDLLDLGTWCANTLTKSMAKELTPPTSHIPKWLLTSDLFRGVGSRTLGPLRSSALAFPRTSSNLS